MSFLDSLAGTGATELPRCSRKGCRTAASWQLRWNNPKLHTPERLKIWLACSEHRAWLEDYLRVRGFFRDTIAFPSAEGEG
ncbi:hypothetical protein FHU41_000434 [Psychromicrobium silvestre]|uniref:Acetone carboxylase n=1 Tax=Psychromicrobium silvestre TaxID=1645614 RepID=A0A7Y9LRF1_9MICC|nr:hypothetical protein [Psychromicrobium silvestre]NYE94213.1 hypothetical protein [Psychromicrobium silvestre]